MAGIVSYGAYIPIYRLSRAILGQVWGGGGKGEKAIANWDEDSITMAVEAGMDCLQGIEKRSVDALYFASTTPPFKEKQSASIIAAGLDLREDIIAADFCSSLRSGTIALRAALDAVKAGSARQVLVIASDCRPPAPNSAFEPLFGDGAAAFLVGTEGVVAEIAASYYLTSEFIDIWRLECDLLPRTWEERFVLDEGYEPHMKKAFNALLKANNATVKDFAKAAFYAPTARSHGAMARAIGLDAKTQVQDPLFDSLGNTGAAFAPMILVAALEEAKPGDQILLGNYGDGADAHIVKVAPGIEKLKDRRGIKRHLESKVMLENYGKYLKFKNLIQFEETPMTRTRTSLPAMWRDRNWQYRCHGHKCNNCGKTQYPLQKRCMYCQAEATFLEEVPLSDRKGVLFTYSMDERAAVVDPPNVLAAVNLEGGGRIFSQMTDRDVNNLRVGMPMELTFRKIHDALGVHNYSWKCRPARA
ncbi:MAG: 3-hydroxy-3-methylglutaryl CoA synthase [Chloroflexi bacterium]|nr:MAG: 3-hydroxy-3-methylglutaryl CoA synthase [Chloroflexota bacterium]RLC96490.1 MAG: 3-hydroxy-3-methylglutaryl CoA synthase [Chloroflexota bacterium]